MPTSLSKLIVALDVPTLHEALRLAEQLDGKVGLFKVGLELCTAVGVPTVLTELRPAPVMLDLKLHDIPNTMAGAVRAAARFDNVRFLTCHASAGVDGLLAAQRALPPSGRDMHLAAVTVLTSLDGPSCYSVYRADPEAVVRRFVEDAHHGAGLTHFVCSPLDLLLLNEGRKPSTRFITPGVRPSWASSDDQARAMTPKEAVDAGADYLVLGRPITKPPAGMTPAQAVDRILEELEK